MYHYFLSCLAFFSTLPVFTLTYYSLGAYFNSYFSFFKRFIVTLAVVATLVANSKAPPAKLTLQPLHFHMPQDVLLT
jgi:hypothetical protein